MGKVTSEHNATIYSYLRLQLAGCDRFIRQERQAWLRRHIDDAIRRVTAAGERIRERQRLEQEQAERERIAQVPPTRHITKIGGK